MLSLDILFPFSPISPLLSDFSPTPLKLLSNSPFSPISPLLSYFSQNSQTSLKTLSDFSLNSSFFFSFKSECFCSKTPSSPFPDFTLKTSLTTSHVAPIFHSLFGKNSPTFPFSPRNPSPTLHFFVLYNKNKVNKAIKKSII